MSPPYHDGSRSLRDRFDTRRLADRIEEKFLSWPVIDADDRAFIERMDMFGYRRRRRPPAVLVQGRRSRVRPGARAHVPHGLHRLRLRAQAFPTCPRYLHRMALLERSRFVPRSERETPIPDSKQSAWASDVLPEVDPARKS